MSEGTVLLTYCHDGETVSHSWHQSMMSLAFASASRLMPTGGPLMVRTGTGGLVSSRNTAARKFLDEYDAEWLLILDTDMGFQPDLLERLIEAADPVERPVVGALCFSFRMGDPDGYGGYHVQPVPTIYGWYQDAEKGVAGFAAASSYQPDTLMRVNGTGSAAILIHRTALEKVRAAEGGDTWYDPIRYTDGRWVGEDLSFCYRLMTADIPLHVHTGIRTTHHKSLWVGESTYLADKTRREALRLARAKAEENGC